MGTNTNRRRKGQGGLYIIRKQAWNEVRQSYELADFYQATKEIQDPNNPGKRKKVYGTARSADEALSRLNKNLERYYTNKGLSQAGVKLKTRQRGLQSVEEYLEEWHSEIRPAAVSPQLRYKYWGHIKNHISPHIGKMNLIDLEYQDVQKLFYETLPAKRKLVKGEEVDLPLLGSNALLNIYKTLNQALNVAVKKRKIERNPLELVKAPTYKAPNENIPQMMHIAEHIFQKMYEENDPLFDHFILGMLGLRKGERLGLTFKNLKLNGSNPTLTIASQLGRVTGVGLIVKPATKSGRDRTVSLNEPWLESLKRMKAQRKEQEKLPTFQPKPEFADLVYLKDDGKPYDPNEDNDLWAKVNAKYNAKQPALRGHALRHIAATKMADTGVDREIAMALLGHSGFAISYYYGRVTATKQRPQVEAFGAALSEKIGIKTNL